MPAKKVAEKPKSILKASKKSETVPSDTKGKGKAPAKVVKEVKVAAGPTPVITAKGTKRERAVDSTGPALKKQAKTSAPVSSVQAKGKKAGPSVAAPAVDGEGDEVKSTSQMSSKASQVEELDEGEAAGASASDEESGNDDEELLRGFSDVSDADSSDDEDAGSIGEITKSGVVKLPSSRDDAAVKTRLDNVQKKKIESGRTSSTPMVLYFGRVPRSMPEEPLRTYLTQFGNISRLRLSRSKQTGASKHYAFVEFEDEEVGQIVQETMNNYLLEGRLLQVRIIPKDKVHPKLWVGANRKWRKVPEARRFRVTHDEPKTEEEKERVHKKLLKRQEQRREKIQKQGIDYEFEGYT